MLHGLLFFFLLLYITELQHHLQSVLRTGSIQPIVAALTSMFYQRLRRLGISQQVLLHIGTDIFIVGLREERTIHVIDVLGNGLHTYPTLTGFDEDFQNLTVVTH